MALQPDQKYEIVYRVDGDEETATARYRGLGTADELARGEPAPTEDAEEFHWFQVDGEPGFLVVDPDDLVSFEPSE